MSTNPPSHNREPKFGLAVGLVLLLFTFALISGGLAVLEYQTPLKPVSRALELVRGRTEATIAPGTVAEATDEYPTFTPTAGLRPLNAAHTPTPTPSLTATVTSSPTLTPTPDVQATELAQARATIVTLATARAQGTAIHLTPLSVPATATPTTSPTATTRATAPPRTTATPKPKTPAKQPATKPATKKPTARPKATPKPRPPRLKGRVAFPVFDVRRGTYDIYVAKVDGSGLQLLINQASEPDLRKDGQMLAFRSWKNDTRGLAVLSFTDGETRRISTFLEDASPKWSPDGGDIVFFSRRESDRKSRIYRFSVNGHNEMVLKDGPNVAFGESPAWTSDGRIIYRQVFPDTGIAIMDGFGGSSQLLLADDSATAPAASPNGRYIAFMSRRDGNWEIYRIKLDGTGLRRLTKNDANDGLPVWSGDSRSILFVSDRGGSWGMYAMNANGGGQRRLFALPGPIDGRVAREPDFVTRGWVEESISWIP